MVLYQFNFYHDHLLQAIFFLVFYTLHILIISFYKTLFQLTFIYFYLYEFLFLLVNYFKHIKFYLNIPEELKIFKLIFYFIIPQVIRLYACLVKFVLKLFQMLNHLSINHGEFYEMKHLIFQLKFPTN